MLDELCERPLIEKTRYRIEHQGLIWEIDEFAGDNRGLIIAEVELEEEDQAIMLPDWVGKEVTGDPRYYNASLITDPFTSWPLESRQ
jgi:CYTH domain-containing protein